MEDQNPAELQQEPEPLPYSVRLVFSAVIPLAILFLAGYGYRQHSWLGKSAASHSPGAPSIDFSLAFGQMVVYFFAIIFFLPFVIYFPVRMAGYRWKSRLAAFGAGLLGITIGILTGCVPLLLIWLFSR